MIKNLTIRPPRYRHSKTVNFRILARTLRFINFVAFLHKKGKGCHFSYEQEHDPLRMFGPTNGVSSLAKYLCHVDSSNSRLFAT